jgi:hypothetical protein
MGKNLSRKRRRRLLPKFIIAVYNYGCHGLLVHISRKAH